MTSDGGAERRPVGEPGCRPRADRDGRPTASPSPVPRTLDQPFSEGLRDEAEEVLRLARRDPAQARAIAARRGSPWPALSADVETATIAHIALGVASAELYDLPSGRNLLERARDMAVGAGFAQWASEARRNLAVVLATGGHFDAALAELERIPYRRGDLVSAKAEGQRGLILQRLGRTEEALAAYRRALSGVRREGDRLAEANIRSNRGLLHAYAGRFEAADAELVRAVRLYRQLDRPLEAAYVNHNRGFVAARQGDFPAALRAYEDAARAMVSQGIEHPGALLDHCETLLRVGLIPEARQVGGQAVEQLERSGMETDLAEARLLLAEAALAAGELDQAEELAVLAQTAFSAQGRRSWEVQARYAWLRVRWAKGDRSEEAMRGARSLAENLQRSGWAASATDARVIAARIALERGDAGFAEVELGKEARRRRGAPTGIRIQAWHAEALLRLSRGDTRGARSALWAGMRVLAAHRAALGATELRVNAGTQADDLGRLGVTISIGKGETERVLIWAERSRAFTVRLSPVRPPADEEVAARLAELREVDTALAEAAASGLDTRPLLRRKAGLEDAIRRKTWHASGFGNPHAPSLSLRALRQALGERTLVEYVQSGGDLHAVTMCDGRLRLHRVARLTDVDREVDALRFSLSRLASGQGNERSRHAMAQGLAAAAESLDACLLRPLGLPPRRPLVVVPTGPLHVLPWSALSSCRDRSVSVCPSATIWMEAARRDGRRAGPAILAAGPGLDHARAELDDLAAIYPDAVRIEGRAATARSLLAALDGAWLAHVAAHGTFRADNPLFSALEMSDGRLTVYELERLARAPQRMVLSSCQGGMSVVRPGNELMGLSAALFALGTATLVASMLVVSDSDTRALMVELHRRLAAGQAAAAALAEARMAMAAVSPRAAATGASFVCFGA